MAVPALTHTMAFQPVGSGKGRWMADPFPLRARSRSRIYHLWSDIGKNRVHWQELGLLWLQGSLGITGSQGVWILLMPVGCGLGFKRKHDRMAPGDKSERVQ